MKNTKESIMKNFLIATPQARERRQKVRAIAFLLQRMHPAIRGLSKDLMIEIVDDTIAFERYWRLILSKEENKQLRGSDYDGRGFKSNKQLEQEHQVNLGYEVGANMKIVV